MSDPNSVHFSPNLFLYQRKDCEWHWSVVVAHLRVWLQSVSCFTGTSLSWNPKPLTTERRLAHGRPGIVALGGKPDTIIEDICQVGDHLLDSASNFILRQIQKPIAKYFPDNWDPFDFLPVNIQSNLQKSEALVSTLLSLYHVRSSLSPTLSSNFG